MLLEKFKEAKFDVNQKDKDGNTGLHLACINGRFNVIEIFIQNSIKYNIQLNAKDKNRCTAFHVACKNGHPKIAKLLIQKCDELKIVLNKKDIDNLTAFYWACRNGLSNIGKSMFYCVSHFCFLTLLMAMGIGKTQEQLTFK